MISAYLECTNTIVLVMPRRLTRLWRNKTGPCLQGVQSSEGDTHIQHKYKKMIQVLSNTKNN